MPKHKDILRMHGTTCDSAEIVGVGGTVHVCGRVLDKLA